MTDLIKKKNQTIARLAYILGFTSIVGQVLLLRELIVVFYGNEMAYAIILSGWLFWIALGSFTMSRVTYAVKRPVRMLIFLHGYIFVLLPATIAMTRFVRGFMNVQIGEAIGIIPMCIASYLLLAPLTFILGSIFTLLCNLPKPKQENATVAVGKVYFWEASGATIGGLVYSFVLIHFMPAVHIAFLTGMLNVTAIMIASGKTSKLFKIGLAVLIITFLAYPLGLIRKFDRYTRKIQWEGFNVVAIADSIYGNIALTKMEGEYSLFENGLLSFSTKDPLTAEENVHYALLEHPNPKKILLIGNGIGGSLNEILKHKVGHVDYVELDPMIVQLSKEHLPDKQLGVLLDPRVETIHADGRFLVKRTDRKYDVIIINLGDPYTALINRYYTQEFFKETKRILNPKGVISLSVSSSENYLNRETRKFLQSINTTLKSVFAETKSIPGDTNIFLACTQKGVLTYNPDLLTKRLKERGVQTQYIREYYLPFKLSQDRVAYIEEALESEGTINTDMHPITYLYDIILFSTRFNLAFKNFIAKIEGIRLTHLMAVPFIIFVAGAFFGRKSPTAPVTVSITTTGLSEIVFQLIIILAFQTLYGFAYYKIGLIMASFMGGLVLGSFVARRMLVSESRRIIRTYKLTQLAIFLYPLLLPVVFVIFREVTSLENIGLLASVFAVLPVIAGFIGGVQYPLATHILHFAHKKGSSDVARSAGFLYAVDTFGAALGALLTGAILIPLIGIASLSVLCAAINGAVLMLLLLFSQPARLSARV